MDGRSAELLEYHTEMGRRRLMPGTIDKRMSVLTRCETSAGKPLIECSSTDLRDWLDGHTITAKTRYTYICHLAAFFKWAVLEERTLRNPADRLTRPKLRRGLPRPISTEDLSILVSKAPDARMRAMISLGAYAGLRCMEIARLQAADVIEHPPMLAIEHGKGDRPRVISVAPQIIDVLRAYGMPPHGPVFRDDNGKELAPWKVSHMIREHIHGCGITASAHQLRHAFATEVYRQSNDLRLTQELMGHSSPATTAGYAAWNPERAAEVVARLFT